MSDSGPDLSQIRGDWKFHIDYRANHLHDLSATHFPVLIFKLSQQPRRRNSFRSGDRQPMAAAPPTISASSWVMAA